MLFTLAQCAPFAIALGVELSPAHDLVTGPVLTTTPALAALTMGPVGTLSAAALAAGVNATGDRLLLDTDGVIGTRNRDNDFLPLPETIEQIPAGTSPQEFMDEIHRALIRQTKGRLTDDVAVNLIDRLA